MLKTIRRLPEVQNVGAGKTASVQLPLGRRYHVIWIELKSNAVTVANSLGDFRLLVNGVAQRTMDVATELDVLNKLMGSAYGIYTVSGSTGASNLVSMIPIFLAEPWRTEYAVIDGLAWNAVARTPNTPDGISSLSLEIDCKSGFSATGSIIALAEWDAPTLPGLGNILKWLRVDLPVTSTSATWNTIPTYARQKFQQLSFFDSNITSLKTELDGVTLRDEFITKGRNDAILTARSMTPMSSRFDWVFDYDDLPSSVLDTENAQNFQISAVLADGTARSIRTQMGLWGPPIQA